MHTDWRFQSPFTVVIWSIRITLLSLGKSVHFQMRAIMVIRIHIMATHNVAALTRQLVDQPVLIASPRLR
jgi:hypothetical protein